MRSATVLLLALAACGDPFVPMRAERLDPPAIYRSWWGEASNCARNAGRFERVQWFVVPSGHNGPGLFDCPHSPAGCGGLWVEPHSIYLAVGQLETESAVKHEILHDLLQRTDHPVPPFDICQG